MDTDMLLNHDVEELWNYFYQFNSEQILSYAWEQQSNSPTCVEPQVSKIPVGF
ncbi:hypothetical protein D915_010810 [Fasciola hepatica]|uniref:Uncharacterized protein n=1 Tax=Fasciola hepatica TaxID=6192 RepID=A0A4E0R704_FASHE|nr:hypothetical protein D915_010810 [Fasciola hepatica]